MMNPPPGQYPGMRGEHPSPADQQPAQGRGRRRLWLLLVGVAVIAAVAGIAALAKGFVGTHNEERVGGGVTGQVSGDRDDWTTAVCAEGSVSQPGSVNFRFPDATANAYCMAKSSGTGGMPVSIMIGEFPRDVAVGQELARYPLIHHFAAAPARDRTIVFAPIDSMDRSLLDPLAQFGFTTVSQS